jgi:malonyl-CoA/methylmalonyl-CoA synthetase
LPFIAGNPKVGFRLTAGLQTVKPPRRSARHAMTDNQNMYAMLERRAGDAPDRPAFLTPAGMTTTYGELARDVGRMANALLAAGVGVGDRVTVQVEKSLPNVALYLACLKVGAVFNPLNSGYTSAELDYFLGDAEPSLLVCQASSLEQLAPIARKHRVGSTLLLEPDGSGSLTELAANQSDAHTTVTRTDGDLASLIYTSGTTGRSKGAMITHGNLSSNTRALCSEWRITGQDVMLHALPIFHVHGLFVAINTCLSQGAKVIWLPKFDHTEVMRLMPQATLMMGVPTFYTRLLSAPDFGRETARNMRLFVSGSAPLLAETHDEFRSRAGHAILERYGMTETGMITSNPYDPDGRIAGTVGYPLPGVSVRVADTSGKVLGAGDVGVIEVKGPNVFKGYWRNPEKTAAEFRPDGYFITGDLGTISADGRVTIVGREKDLIISGGLNVYPKEIEEELNAMPGVAEAAVVGVPHPDFGESVIAVLARAPGAEMASEKAIIAQLEGKLAKFKCPKRVFVVDDLPRNAMGKVQKAELRSRYGDSFRAKA